MGTFGRAVGGESAVISQGAGPLRPVTEAPFSSLFLVSEGQMLLQSRVVASDRGGLRYGAFDVLIEHIVPRQRTPATQEVDEIKGRTSAEIGAVVQLVTDSRQSSAPRSLYARSWSTAMRAD